MPDIDIRTWVIRNRLMCKWQIALIQNKSIQYCSSSESRGARHKECQLPEHRSTSMSVESCRRSVDTLQQHSPTTLHAVPLHMTSDCNLHVCLKLAGWANQQWTSQYCCTELQSFSWQDVAVTSFSIRDISVTSTDVSVAKLTIQ